MRAFAKRVIVGVVGLPALFVSLGACSSTDTPSTVSANPTGPVEIFSWWSGSEAPPLASFITAFNVKYPKVKITNSAVGNSAGGVSASAILKQRMAAGNPPDTFQTHAGKALQRYSLPDPSNPKQALLEPINFLYDSEGLTNAIPAALRTRVSTGNNTYSVPFTVSRDNSLYYNKKIFDKYNLQPPTTWAEFATVSATLQQNGVIPLAIGTHDPWVEKDVWLDDLLARMGAARYTKFLAGQLTPTEPEVDATTAQFDATLNYSNANTALVNSLIPNEATAAATVSSQLTWDKAADLVFSGTAAMTIMGDWCKGYFVTTKGWTPGTDFNAVATPSSNGTFVAIVDTFPLALGAPNRDNAILLLKYFASKEGQDLFNPLKGAISARLDSDLTKYDAISQGIAADYKKAVQAGDNIVGAPDESLTDELNLALESTMGDVMTARFAGQSQAQLQQIVDTFLAQRYKDFTP